VGARRCCAVLPRGPDVKSVLDGGKQAGLSLLENVTGCEEEESGDNFDESPQLSPNFPTSSSFSKATSFSKVSLEKLW